MTPSVVTKFQYILTPFIFPFLLSTCFGPYGPSSSEKYNYLFLFLKDYFNTTDPLHACNSIIISKDVICRHRFLKLIVLIHVIILIIKIKDYYKISKNSTTTTTTTTSNVIFLLVSN
jgi:hypothetical protein